MLTQRDRARRSLRAELRGNLRVIGRTRWTGTTPCTTHARQRWLFVADISSRPICTASDSPCRMQTSRSQAPPARLQTPPPPQQQQQHAIRLLSFRAFFSHTFSCYKHVDAEATSKALTKWELVQWKTEIVGAYQKCLTSSHSHILTMPTCFNPPPTIPIFGILWWGWVKGKALPAATAAAAVLLCHRQSERTACRP